MDYLICRILSVFDNERLSLRLHCFKFSGLFLVLDDIFNRFSQHFHENDGTVSQNRPQTLRFTFYPVIIHLLILFLSTFSRVPCAVYKSVVESDESNSQSRIRFPSVPSYYYPPLHLCLPILSTSQRSDGNGTWLSIQWVEGVKRPER